MPTVADLFCGAGGFSLGFARAGFDPVFAVDHDRWACESYAKNIGSHVRRAAIEDVRASAGPEGIVWRGPGWRFTTPLVDVLVGGPPCQGFSPLNREGGDHDVRNELWKQYYRLLKSISPRVFVIENVPQLLQSREFAKLRRRAVSRGYSVAAGLLNAEDFGVPQRRRRAFVIGVLEGDADLPKGNGTRRTVRDAFCGLNIEPDNSNLHVGRNPTALSVRRYACIPPGGNRFDLPDPLLSPCWKRKKTGSTDVFGRMWYDRPAPTIRTEFFKPEKGRYLHPEANRPITLREGARLQTFPDTFEFLGSHTQIAKQIGNAVPVELAVAIAEHLISRYFRKIAA